MTGHKFDLHMRISQLLEEIFSPDAIQMRRQMGNRNTDSSQPDQPAHPHSLNSIYAVLDIRCLHCIVHNE